MSAKQTQVVIGNGMVGQYFLNGLMTSPSKELYKIVIFREEPGPAYDRVHLSDERDDNRVSAEERDQIRPADEQERKHFKSMEAA